MLIGVPKEIKNNENRVALTPAGALQLIHAGHSVRIESNAGVGSGFSNEDYTRAGAYIVKTAKEAWTANMVMKVKEPLPTEFDFFREDLILFTYLHLAPETLLTKALCDKKVFSIAYETIQLEDGSLPLLTPMSEVAGRMSSQIGAYLLTAPFGGKGILLAGVPGVNRAKITIVGGGVAGTNAAKIAKGLGADVTIIDINANRLRELEDIFGASVKTLMANTYNIAEAVKNADLVIGAVLVPGGKAPKIVTEEMVKQMAKGSVIVDISIDQGGCFETIDRITTHDKPTYEKHGVIHYSVANMPGAVPHTSTAALTNVTLPYAIKLANGHEKACLNDSALLKGINVLDGHITYKAVADAQGLKCVDAKTLLQHKRY